LIRRYAIATNEMDINEVASGPGHRSGLVSTKPEKKKERKSRKKKKEKKEKRKYGYGNENYEIKKR
jgi:hypothetical protein